MTARKVPPIRYSAESDMVLREMDDGTWCVLDALGGADQSAVDVAVPLAADALADDPMLWGWDLVRHRATVALRRAHAEFARSERAADLFDFQAEALLNADLLRPVHSFTFDCPRCRLYVAADSPESLAGLVNTAHPGACPPRLRDWLRALIGGRRHA